MALQNIPTFESSYLASFKHCMMRNFVLIVAALFFAGHSFAQQGLELTLGYTPGLSFILNDDDFAEGDDLNFQATYGSHFGLTVGYNFTDFIGVATGFGFASINQNYITDFDGRSRDEQNTFNRRTSYIRIPVLFRVGGDFTRGASAYFRIGPHFDLLTSAEGDYNFNGGILAGSSTYTNYRDVNRPLSSEDAEVYQSLVIGVTMEIGGRIRINDAMGILVAFHLESSLVNPEGTDARFFFPNDGALVDPERQQAWNIMPGLTVGFQYVLSL